MAYWAYASIAASYGGGLLVVGIVTLRDLRRR